MTDTSLQPTTPPPEGVNVSDAAWVRIPTRLSPQELSVLLGDIEVLFRLNPYYYFKSWSKSGPDQYHTEFENQSNQQNLQLDITVKQMGEHGLEAHYQQGMKSRTLFTIESSGQGSVLVLTDDYSGTAEEERKKREPEIDRSLVAWGEAIRMFCLRLQRYSRIPGWRWYMRRVWIPMKPSSRRIVWLLFLISIVEFFFFCFVVLIWWVEHLK